MRYSLTILCLLLMASAATVRAQDVAVDFDKSVNFSKFKTYSWAGGVPAQNPLIHQQIKTHIEQHLAAKGLHRVEEKGDLTVIYLAAVGRDLEVAIGAGEYTKDWMRQTISGINIKSQMWEVEVGTLVVCLSDSVEKNLLWRATAKTTLDKRSSKKNALEAMADDARKVEKRIRRAVEKMFKQYPLTKSAA
jgi:hypothetical protein